MSFTSHIDNWYLLENGLTKFNKLARIFTGHEVKHLLVIFYLNDFEVSHTKTWTISTYIILRPEMSLKDIHFFRGICHTKNKIYYYSNLYEEIKNFLKNCTIDSKCIKLFEREVILTHTVEGICFVYLIFKAFTIF